VLAIQVGAETITCTPEHPFWVPGQGWKTAQHLQVGDSLLSQAGQPLSIESIQPQEGQFQVYNIEVEGFHTYHVSSLQILVHNECGLQAVRRGIVSIAKDAQGNEVFINGKPVEVFGQAFDSSSTTPGHGEAMVNLVTKLAPTGDYEYFTFQSSLRTATGRIFGRIHGEIPDVIGVRRDGKIDIWEVRSTSQMSGTARRELDAKVDRMIQSLPLERQGDGLVIDPEPPTP
jgi:Pretoxin HINT domain